jgi:ATP synthase F1 gamma subunit
MPTLLDFRRRIRSVKNTQQITRAMKFIAAARLRRAQETAVSLRPYAAGIREILRSAMSRIENPEQFPMLAHRPEEKILVLVTSGERGLAGAFNANVHRQERPRRVPQALLEDCRRVCGRNVESRSGQGQGNCRRSDEDLRVGWRGFGLPHL